MHGVYAYCGLILDLLVGLGMLTIRGLGHREASGHPLPAIVFSVKGISMSVIEVVVCFRRLFNTTLLASCPFKGLLCTSNSI
jgi:hypothetical protein